MRALPFEDCTFPLVAFDPPHLERAGPRSWMAAKYGKLGPDWRSDLAAGFRECFRVLEASGTLVFKWSESQISLREVLTLTPHRPLFGNTAIRAGVLIFSPISQCHPIAEAGGLPQGWDFWEPYDRAILGACGAVYVLMLDGWQESRGVAAEIVIARELGLAVEYLEPGP